MLMTHLAAFPVRLDEAQLQPAGRLAEANEHCSGTVYPDIEMAAIRATTGPGYRTSPPPTGETAGYLFANSRSTSA